MTERNQSSRLMLIGLVTLGVAVLVGIFLYRASDDDAERRTAGDAARPGAELAAWASVDDAQAATLQVDPTSGPRLQIGDGASVALGPTAPDLTYTDWQVEPGEGRTFIIGQGRLGGASVRTTWTFADGNPQAHLDMVIRGLPASRLADDISATITLPGGQLDALAPMPAMPDAIAGPMRWSGDDDAGPRLTFSNWSGEAIRAGDDGATLVLDLWDAARHPGLASCAAVDDAPGVELHAQMHLTVGSPTTLARWPYPSGQLAALVPVFDVASHHPDAELAQGTAPDAKRWVDRARTLVYGHSNADDPRYGNGGLLGHGLGATLVVPTKFAGDEAVKAFAKKLAETRVEIAPRDASVEGYEGASRVLGEAKCADIAALAAGTTPGVILADSSAKTMAGGLSAGATRWPATLRPTQLDGRLTSLLDQGLAPDALDGLVARHGVRAFSSPLVATRNPLIGAAKESLLEPERDGQWTVAADLAGALADLELWHEERPLLVTSMGAAARHVAQTRRVQWWWDDSGKLVVFNPRDRAIPGFTLAVRGTARASAGEKNPARTRLLTDEDAGAVTLMWWNLEPGVHTVSVSREGSAVSAPAAVQWRVDQP